MKRVLLFVSVLLFSGMLYGQPGQNKINVVISIKCVNSSQFSIWNDTIREGQNYSLRPVTLPASYANAQALYNSIVGSYFVFEEGCLDTNVQIKITFSNVDCSNGLFLPSNLTSVFFNWKIEVFTFDGLDPMPVPFTFKTPNAFRLVVLRSALFNQFVTLSGINPAALLAFAYIQATGTFSLEGITTEMFTDSIRVRVSHFSEIVGGTKSSLTSAEEALPGIPENFALNQNYPNPFNPSTKISYSIATRSDVVLKIYDVMGVEVAKLVNETKEAGNYEVAFDATGLPSGIYVYKLHAGNVVLNKKMLLVK